jgi:hypothetical protein
MNLSNLMTWSQGKKTYIVILAGVVIGIAQHFGIQIPWYVNLGLLALGGASLRAGITGETQKSADDIAALVGSILTAAQAPPQTVQLPSGKTITLGKPSAVGPSEEPSATAALNQKQAGNG